jgi:oligopeptide/dipeptide ABC transporter ATP-binding protein
MPVQQPMSSVAEAETLVVEFRTRSGRVRALDGADLSVGKGERVGLVGESGSGKSTLALALGRLLPPNAMNLGGGVRVSGKSVFELDDSELRALRRHNLGYVFQDPIGTFDPTMRIGRQIETALDGMEKAEDIAALLASVGLGDVQRIMRSYPHELSGGMAQRVSIAIAIAPKPELLIADEPTASLDASIRRQILDLVVSLCSEFGVALLLLSHDLGAINRYCERVAVMYGGRVVETGLTDSIFSNPLHPYTEALLRAAPGQEPLGGQIEPIPGRPPMLTNRMEMCSFAPRCRLAIADCHERRPERKSYGDRSAVCFISDDRNRAITGRPLS